MKGMMKMRKRLLLILAIILISLALLGNSKASDEGILLRDYPNTTLLKSLLHIDENSMINEIIILPVEDFDEKNAALMISNIQQLPTSLLTKIQENDIYLKLFTGKLTDNPTANHLKGLIPRGYKSDKKWDDVPGIGGGKIVLVKIGHSEKGMGHGSINLELHELAHSIDRIVYKKLRYDPFFLNVWTKEKHSLFKGKTYFITLPEEYFAEAFAMYYKDEVNRAILEERAPETYEYIKNLK
jgi:Pro-Pro endopeptidase